jgi:hypothetical protein
MALSRPRATDAAQQHAAETRSHLTVTQAWDERGPCGARSNSKSRLLYCYSRPRLDLESTSVVNSSAR